MCFLVDECRNQIPMPVKVVSKGEIPSKFVHDINHEVSKTYWHLGTRDINNDCQFPFLNWWFQVDLCRPKLQSKSLVENWYRILEWLFHFENASKHGGSQWSHVCTNVTNYDCFWRSLSLINYLGYACYIICAFGRVQLTPSTICYNRSSQFRAQIYNVDMCPREMDR